MAHEPALLDDEYSYESTVAGLKDAREALAEVWRLAEGEARARAKRALQAVLSAQRTMQAADDFLLARSTPERQAAFDALRRSCLLRVGGDVRKTP
jgi:regulator of protease activity HflC (stomatin/prohibitin superfamily)